MSTKILEMYHKAGVKIDGKGLHTEKFHKVALAIKRENPNYEMSRCYRIAMARLTPAKAVKKEHRR